MAYMNQEKKKVIAAALKAVVPAGWKYSLAVRNHSTLVMTIKSAPVDLLGEALTTVLEGNGLRDPEQFVRYHNEKGYIDVNTYHPHHYFKDSLPVIESIIAALNTNNHNNSDIQSDYFDVGHYIDLNIGTWEVPFRVNH